MKTIGYWLKEIRHMHFREYIALLQAISDFNDMRNGK